MVPLVREVSEVACLENCLHLAQWTDSKTFKILYVLHVESLICKKFNLKVQHIKLNTKKLLVVLECLKDVKQCEAIFSLDVAKELGR